MKLHEMTKGDPELAVKLTDLAERAGISMDQARYALVWVLEEVFAKGHWHSDGSDARMQITVQGCDEVERLGLPAWRRWLGIRDFRIALAATLVGGIIAGIVVGLILKWLP